jgi:hypothetical protein
MTQDTNDWANSPLYKALVEALPAFVKDPFSASPRLDVKKLYTSMNMSNEGMYRWLRQGRVTHKGAQKLFALAHEPLNTDALAKLGREAPDSDYFARLCFALA